MRLVHEESCIPPHPPLSFALCKREDGLLWGCGKVCSLKRC